MGVKSWVFKMEEKGNTEISVLAFAKMVSGPKQWTKKSPFLHFILFPTVKFLFVQNIECSRSHTSCSTGSRACWGTYAYPRTPRFTHTKTHSLLQKEWIHTFTTVSKEGQGRCIFTLLWALMKKSNSPARQCQNKECTRHTLLCVCSVKSLIGEEKQLTW